MRIFKSYGKKLILKELKKSYNFFTKEINLNSNSPGYGLIRDKSLLTKNVASIASVGYGLACLVIGVKNKWLNYNILRKYYRNIKNRLHLGKRFTKEKG